MFKKINSVVYFSMLYFLFMFFVGAAQGYFATSAHAATKFDLSWDANKKSDNVTSYNIFIAINGNKKKLLSKTTLLKYSFFTCNNSNFKIKNITSVCISLTATNKIGTSNQSASACVTLSSADYVPGETCFPFSPKKIRVIKIPK